MFFSKEMPKQYFDLFRRCLCERSQQEGLDGEFVAAESGPVADVRDRLPAASGALVDGLGDEDAARQNAVGSRGQVESGDRLPGADAMARDNGTLHRETAAKQAS